MYTPLICALLRPFISFVEHFERALSVVANKVVCVIRI